MAMTRNDFREVGSGQIHVPDTSPESSRSTNEAQKEMISSTKKHIQKKQPLNRVANEPIPKKTGKRSRNRKRKVADLNENNEPGVRF